MLGEVDGSGNITASRKYDVYGKVRATVGTSTSTHKFVGSLGHPSEDGTGLIYMRARYYDPVAGRFLSTDPAHSGDNWFCYSDNNPVNKVDRDGKEANAELVAGALATIFAGCVLSHFFRGVFLAAFFALLLPEMIVFGALVEVGCAAGGLLPGGGAMLVDIIARGVLDSYKMAVGGLKQYEGVSRGPWKIAAEIAGFYTGYSAMLYLTSEFLDATCG